jgi:hypothetical protein
MVGADTRPVEDVDHEVLRVRTGVVVTVVAQLPRDHGGARGYGNREAGKRVPHIVRWGAADIACVDE